MTATRGADSGTTGGTYTDGALGRFLAAYRGNLPRAEAARRSGLSERRWIEVEGAAHGNGDDALRPLPAHSVAAMCVAVGADVATGLELAGYDPGEHRALLAAPPGHMHVRPPLGPHIAFHRAIADVTASEDSGDLIASIYRAVASGNRELADRITAEPPDERAEYWQGYTSALRAIADEQTRIADLERASGD